jgi:hypothetical protein
MDVKSNGASYIGIMFVRKLKMTIETHRDMHECVRSKVIGNGTLRGKLCGSCLVAIADRRY